LNISKDQRILITGGTGVLGKFVVRQLLDAGYTNLEVFTRSGRSSDTHLSDDDRITFTKGDIRELYPLADSIERADYVIHAAALVSFNPKEFKRMHAVNVEGTANVINLATTSKVRKFIHVSSIAALGRSEKGHPISEETKWVNSKYNSYYGITKYLAEQEVWRAYFEGQPIVIVNPALILGEGDWDQSSLQIFRKVYNGLPYYPGGGTGVVDVKDVARFIVLLMESAIQGERYILSAENLSYQSIFTKMAEAMKRKVPKKRAPVWMLSILWRIERLRCLITGRSPLVTRESVKSTAHQSIYYNSKSLSLPDFQYRNVDDTIREYSQAYAKSRNPG